jgi:aspartate-semialdehyde dehydrogenase
MADRFDVAVVGVSTLVGETLVTLLAERGFPVGTLYPLDTADQAGGRVEFKGSHLRVGDVARFDFSQTQLAFFCADADVSAAYVPQATAAGCVVIDDSGLFRLEPDVPLVVAEVNPEALAGWRERRIIANPNASTVLMLTALKPIHDAAGITRINVATYQAVSGVGREGLEELGRQTAALFNMQGLETPVFSRQIAFNILPHIGELEDNGYTHEEMKMVRETRKILADEAIGVNPTTVRVPVFYGHAMALHIETRDRITAARARELLQNAAGVDLSEEAPSPVTEASGEDAVFVGRIRQDISYLNGLDMWLVGDNVRKGGALNCIQIAQVLVKGYM